MTKLKMAQEGVRRSIAIYNELAIAANGRDGEVRYPIIEAVTVEEKKALLPKNPVDQVIDNFRKTGILPRKELV